MGMGPLVFSEMGKRKHAKPRGTKMTVPREETKAVPSNWGTRRAFMMGSPAAGLGGAQISRGWRERRGG